MPATPAWPPRSLPRLFLDEPLAAGGHVATDAAQANYLGNVLRLGEGGEVLVFNGRDGEWLGQIVDTGRKRIVLLVDRPTRPQENVPALTLAFAPIKKARVDWLVEKAVELGVAHLQPVITQRTIVDKLNLDRMRSHIIEAAEQCGRTALATIAEPVKLNAFLRDLEGKLYFADETGGAGANQSFTIGPATILIGPEGGFTSDEAVAIRGAAGAVAISLGPRILRAETAALAAITAWMSVAGDWG